MRRLRVHVVVLASVVGLAGGALAQPQKKEPPKKEAPKPKAPPLDTKTIVPKLESADQAQIRGALDEVRIAGPGGAPAAPAIAKALSRGLTFALAMQAVETLGEVESDAGSPVLAQYASHRDPKLRRAAVKALVRTKGAAAAPALRHALSDIDAVVRGTAASGLGVLKAKEAVPDLFLALEHHVNEAAASIGMLCNPQQCEELAGKLGKFPFDVVTGGLDQVLFRPTTEISDDAKIKVIGRVRELGTIEANKFLRDVQKRWTEGSSKRVRQAIDQAVLATSGGAK